MRQQPIAPTGSLDADRDADRDAGRLAAAAFPHVEQVAHDPPNARSRGDLDFCNLAENKHDSTTAR